MFKKCITFTLIFLICMSTDVVFADGGQLKAEEISVTCVYENGLELNAFYSENAYGILSNDLQVINMIKTPISTGITVFYNESSLAKKIVDSGTCPDQMIGGMVSQWVNIPDDYDTLAGTFTLYSSTSDEDKLHCFHTDEGEYPEVYSHAGMLYCKNPKKFDFKFFGKNHVQGPNDSPDYGYWIGSDVDFDSAVGKKCGFSRTNYDGNYVCDYFKLNLISERVEINTETTPLGQWAFKSEGDQAASKTMYASIYKYKLPNGSEQLFLEKDQIMTKIVNQEIKEKEPIRDENTNEVIGYSKINYMCLAPSTKTIEGSAFAYSDIRHKASIYYNDDAEIGTYGCNEDAGYTVYKEVNWSEFEEEATQNTSICDVIPQTALILAEFTKWARIIVPAFLIILTGFDISRIVINGNLEEELPKRKKHITIRAIVAMFFFFLPLFVQAVISVAPDIDFGDISCIWD